jgi:uncharacterized protein with PIN domain
MNNVAVKFIVDVNTGKVARWLRMMGYDTLLFTDKDDGKMVKIGVQQNRILVTRDCQVMQRKLVTTGKLKAILVESTDPKLQLKQVVRILNLDYRFQPFSRCIQCNQPLIERTRDEVRNHVPPHVFEIQTQYMECPKCRHLYWQGTHWSAMSKELENFMKEKTVTAGG